MAFRPLAQAWARACVRASDIQRATYSSAPTVFDKLVQIIVVDPKGHRHTLLGREGQKLTEVLQDNADQLGGEGIGQLEAHITVPNELLSLIPEPVGVEERYLKEIAPNIYKNSRLASRVILSKAMNGISIALGDTYPWKTL